MLRKKTRKGNWRGAFSIAEITVAIFIMAVLTASAYMIFGGKSKDLQINSELTTGLRELSNGLASYKNNSALANYDFASLSALNILPFMDKNVFDIDAANTYIFLKRMPEVKFTFVPNQSEDGVATTNNKAAKVLVNFSALGTVKGLTNEELAKFENITARHFSETSAGIAKIGGNQTTLGAANAGAITIGAANDDGIILIDKIF